MISGSIPIDPSICPGSSPLDPAALEAEVQSLARGIHDLVNNPASDSADLCDLARRIARLEVQARTLTTEELSRWLESLRGLLKLAR